MRELCLPEDLHPSLTGQTGPKQPIRVRSYILTRDLIGFRLLTGTDLPTLYIYIYMKGHGRLSVIPIESTHLSFTFYLQTLAFPTPCCSSLVSTAFEGVLGGLPTTGQP